MPSGVYERKSFMRSVRVTERLREAILCELRHGRRSQHKIATRYGVSSATVSRLKGKVAG